MEKTLKRERRYFTGLELRAAQDGPPTIVGYAAVFNEPSKLLFGSFYEIIEPTYFDDILASPKLDVRAYKNHNQDIAIGRFCPSKDKRSLILGKDQRGLVVTLNPPDTQAGRDMVQDIRAGIIDEMSIGHWVAEDTISGTMDGYPIRRLIRCLDIDDVSFLSKKAAYPGTSAELRALPGEMGKEEYENLVLARASRTTPLDIRKRQVLLLDD